MKPQKLVICGWGPYKNKTEVDFEQFEGKGIFLITGATGAGKTTLFDAISYALYGALSGETRDKERSSVRSDFADAQTPTYVELEMTHAGKFYRIRRNPEYMRPKKRGSGEKAYTREKENAVICLPDNRVIEGVKEVNAYIRELLALDFGQFKQLSMIAQGEFAKLLTAPPRDKTRIFREIFGTGVYERFTAILGMRAKKQYQLIMEQKHRLEEDIRVLRLSIQGREAAEAEERFLQLTEAEYWNYEQIGRCLEEMKDHIQGMCRVYDKDYKAVEKQLDQAGALLVQKREENKRVLEYRSAKEAAEKLADLREEYEEKQKQYQKAVHAGWVELSDLKSKQAEEQLKAVFTEKQILAEEMIENQAAVEALMPFWKRKEELKLLIGELAEYEKKEKELAELEKDLEQSEKKLAREKEIYVQKEQLCQSAKAEYEEALRMQRYGAIGLAAALLEQGKPCPVCGSTEHPAPAKNTVQMPSEEETQELRKHYESLEEKVRESHGKALILQSKAEEKKRSLEEERKQQQLRKERMEAATEPVCTELLSLGAKKAEEKWQANCDTMQRKQAMLQEKERRLRQLEELKAGRMLEKEAADREFEAALDRYGFETEKEYREAYLPGADRERLGKAVDQYQEKVTANRELLEHLRRSVGEDVLFDLQALEKDIAGQRLQREEVLKRLKKEEHFLTEIKKTSRLFAEKVGKIEECSREYGYMKELENMASGNNSKKLVFEQYVLAGYFEEILNAANIRFRKMTAGRYEMRRTKEVGDGRIKDNLEIEVLDYYTGKYRSIRTLSGGESFKASLSLALGLSDVIQAQNGGIKVETLFIDEGFGALDSESLDQACAALTSLVESDRLIGIISHVGELRERIHKQIIIDKSGSGSTLRVIA